MCVCVCVCECVFVCMLCNWGVKAVGGTHAPSLVFEDEDFRAGSKRKCDVCVCVYVCMYVWV